MIASVLKLKGIDGSAKLRRYMTKIDYIPSVSANSSILEALKSIEVSQRGFCLVDDKEAWGILTDGDIRRYVIKNQEKDLSLSDDIKGIVNYSPFHIDVNYNVENLLCKLVEENFYKRLNFAVLTEYNKPVGILVLSKIYGSFSNA